MPATARIALDQPADDVWAVVGRFGRVESWMAGIDSCRVEGDVRTIETMGMTIQEQLVRRDTEARSLTYSIVGETSPVDVHRATITVTDSGEGTSVVTWDVVVTPDEASAMFGDVYQGALHHLKTHLEG